MTDGRRKNRFQQSIVLFLKLPLQRYRVFWVKNPEAKDTTLVVSNKQRECHTTTRFVCISCILVFHLKLSPVLKISQLDVLWPNHSKIQSLYLPRNLPGCYACFKTLTSNVIHSQDPKGTCSRLPTLTFVEWNNACYILIQDVRLQKFKIMFTLIYPNLKNPRSSCN